MKFFNLFRKELKEMLTVQTIVMMFVLVGVLYASGNAISGTISDSTENSKNIVICDKDDTDFTKYILSEMEGQIKQQCRRNNSYGIVCYLKLMISIKFSLFSGSGIEILQLLTLPVTIK